MAIIVVKIIKLNLTIIIIKFKEIISVLKYTS